MLRRNKRNRGERELRGERYGTGERSSIIRRPLCLFMNKKIIFTALVAVFPLSVRPAAGQDMLVRKLAVQVRVGGMVFSPLVEDAVRSGAVEDSIPAEQSDAITVRQSTAPALAVAVLYPLQQQVQLELSGSIASSMVRGEDDFGAWDFQRVSTVNGLIGLGYSYRPFLMLHGGVGVTRLFGGEHGLFAKGNTIRPLVEAGASIKAPFYRGLEFDARVQSHTFSTGTLRDDGGNDGNVLRVVAGLSLTLGGGQ